jgi:hypothetical protein
MVLKLIAFLSLVLLLFAAPSSAQVVGAVAALDGTVEINHAGPWLLAELAGPISKGDQVRTGRPGRVRIVFADESVLELAEGSLVTINEQVFDPSAGSAKTAIELLGGKLRALVSGYYQKSGNAYEIRTLTAVAGVRGTTFLVAYEGDGNTEVVGVDGYVSVYGMPQRGAGVRVTTQEISVVASGVPPSPARRLDDSAYQRFLSGFDFIGAGASQVANMPLIAGTELPDVDRIIALPPMTFPHAPLWTATDTLIPIENAGNVAGQPLPVVEAAGRLRIRLF